MPKSAYASRVREPVIAADVDQIEWVAIRSGSAVVDDATRDELVSGELDDEAELRSDEAGTALWQEQDLAQEEIVGPAVQEIAFRIEQLGTAYPFELAGNKLVYRPSGSGFYEFCLATCRAPSVTKKPYVVLPRYFERVVAVLVRYYFGIDKRALHVGWPRRPKSKFKLAMSPLGKQKYEWVWGPEDGLSDDPTYTEVKDETVDFVVTVGLLDSRPGNLYILGQCACGNDWNTKLAEPDQKRISKWFRPAWIVPPVSTFTTPYVLGLETLRETSRRSSSIVFDRIRLSLIAETILPESRRNALKRRIDPVIELVT
ncbi:MAG: hypothetical protein KDI75_03950 [Xanthomonadales bacterium]|nr:hypothetical protein [Xanthomonadales bacterium]